MTTPPSPENTSPTAHKEEAPAAIFERSDRAAQDKILAKLERPEALNLLAKFDREGVEALLPGEKEYRTISDALSCTEALVIYRGVQLVWGHRTAAQVAVCFAGRVLDIFEGFNPGEGRPREALEAARAWVPGHNTGGLMNLGYEALAAADRARAGIGFSAMEVYAAAAASGYAAIACAYSDLATAYFRAYAIAAHFNQDLQPRDDGPARSVHKTLESTAEAALISQISHMDQESRGYPWQRARYVDALLGLALTHKDPS